MEGVMQQSSSANYIPLTPISFLERAAKLHPHTTSVIHNTHLTFSWNLTYQRCTRLASALSSNLGISPGHYVAAVAPNIPELYELHFGVPMAGAILSTINPRFDAITLSLIMQQLQPKIIFLDQQYVDLLLTVFNLLDEKQKLTTSNTTWPLFVVINSKHHHACRTKLPPNTLLYEQLLDDMGASDFKMVWPKHECDPILVNYTSGSTGNPKGVVYSHRAVYLNTLGEILRSDLRDERFVFLWTAEMFRANGWGFTWATAALGGTNVFPDPQNGILGSISLHGVTHLSGHPSILLQALEEAHDGQVQGQFLLPHKVYVHIAGVLPPSDIMLKLKEMGFQVVHRYGMTEVLGPPVNKLWACDPATETMNQPAASNMMDQLMEQVDVKNPHTMESVPCDGQTMGEVMFRGNALMTGYLKAPSHTEATFEGGWFHTQDMAVKHQDGRIQLKDRTENMINVSERDGVSSLEIEVVLLTHPKILEAAVVGMPNTGGDQSAYEVPCAFVKLKNGVLASQGEIVKFCRERLPSEMTPRRVVFGNLVTNSSGKVQKFILREMAREMSREWSAGTNFV